MPRCTASIAPSKEAFNEVIASPSPGEAACMKTTAVTTVGNLATAGAVTKLSLVDLCAHSTNLSSVTYPEWSLHGCTRGEGLHLLPIYKKYEACAFIVPHAT